jgi:hypothetical protein
MIKKQPHPLSTLEYIAQVSAHRSRLVRVATKLYGKRSLVTRLCDWHDVEKWPCIVGLLVFKSHKYPELARSFYDLMNGVGKLIFSIIFFFEKKRLSQELEHALSLERVLDVLDRAQDPVAFREFGGVSKTWRSFLSPEQITLAEEILKTNPWENEFPECNLLR